MGLNVQHNKKVGGKVVTEYLGKKESGARKICKEECEGKKISQCDKNREDLFANLYFVFIDYF